MVRLASSVQRYHSQPQIGGRLKDPWRSGRTGVTWDLLGETHVGGMIIVTLVSSANERPGRVARVGRRERGEMSQIKLGLHLFQRLLWEIFQKYNHNFSSLVYLWLTYVYGHAGMLICTHIMLVCTRRPLQGVGSSRLHSSNFLRSRKRRGNTRQPIPGRNNVIHLISCSS